MKIFEPTVEFNADLLQKYDLPLPRYTSYPPATQLTTDFSELNLRAAIAINSKDLIRLLVSLIKATN